MKGVHSKTIHEEQPIYEEPKTVTTKGNEYIDLQPGSATFRRYDQLKSKKSLQEPPVYTDISQHQGNYNAFENLNSSDKQSQCNRQRTTFVVAIVITCILSIGVTLLIFHLANNTSSSTNFSRSCESINCDTGQCYVNTEGQPVCIRPERSSGIPNTNSFYPIEIQSECPDGWIAYENSCYKEIGMRRTWFQSRSYCRSIGADLVSIHDEDEAIFLDMNLDDRHMYWIGFSNFELGNNFTWSDGSSTLYRNWGPGEPNNEHNNERCGHLSRNDIPRQWNDINCLVSIKFVCKKEIMPQCGPGSWFYNDNSCYSFNIDMPDTWDSAMQACIDEGAELLSINSIEENDFIVSRVTKTWYRNVWIGLHEGQNGEYLWVDGSKPTMTYWGVTIPDDVESNCVRILSEYGTWEYRNCDEFNGYICEKKLPK